MRSLAKGPVPRTIAEQGSSLTAAYKSAPANNKTSPWKAADILEALKDETYSKCAYCESKVGAVAWEHIEHYRPKAHFPDLVVNWQNLTLACPKCNVYKGAHNPDSDPLVDPYEENVEERFMFAGSLLFPRPGDVEARDTILLLKLYRRELEDERKKAINAIDSLVHTGRAPVNRLRAQWPTWLSMPPKMTRSMPPSCGPI